VENANKSIPIKAVVILFLGSFIISLWEILSKSVFLLNFAAKLAEFFHISNKKRNFAQRKR